ncbi:MAG: hypothetical protein OXE87_16680 [Chloroflexi bacterium]|nr:hypothetical protein [Chloroflexota bacterium]
MTLATAIMAGLFVFLRFPVLEVGSEGAYSIPAAVVILGVLFAGGLYVGCIWSGMAVLADNSVVGKSIMSGLLRGLTIALVVLVFLVVTAGIFTHIEETPTEDKLQGGGGVYPITKGL